METVSTILSVTANLYILLLVHSQIFRYKLGLKKVALAILFFYIWAVVYGIISSIFSENFLSNLLLYPSYFMVYTYFILRGETPKIFLVFYSIFPLAFWDVLHSFIVYFIVSNVPLLAYSKHVMTFTILLAGLMLLALIRVFRYDFSHLRTSVLTLQKRIVLTIATIIMILYYATIPYIVYLEQGSGQSLNSVREIITAIYFILFICFVNILDRNLHQELQEQVMLQKEIQLQNINNYSKQVEGLYQEVRGFRHDYANILTSLKIGIDAQDINMISEIYDTVLKESGKTLKNHKFDVARLRNISDFPLKSLLLSKLAEAHNLGIPVSLEITSPISFKNIEQIDFLTIISILLDNAIEAAAEAGDRADLVLCFFESLDTKKQVVIVQNSTLEREIDVSKIFERGVSSKGNNRGIGLSNVCRILKSYPNVSLKTASGHFTFKQILEIE